MTDDQIKQLCDDNFRICMLLGYATSIIMDYKRLDTYHDNTDKCDWFFQAIQNVVYEKKPLPPIP
jgi:hypothetical protein